MGPWTLELRSNKNLVTPIVIKDENGAPVDIAGWFFAIEIEHDEGTETYSTATGHFSIAAPTNDGKVILTVPKTEIADLPFEWAAFRSLAGPTSDEADEMYDGKAKRS